ncbi:hypothetical protein PAMC26577_10555 [Caballeronia sordidicola]|uniref:Uncharacterized protein n=1 Tax=Caballeronia sordidicola TaxID=196367 RepID=A0A242MYJ3_CABSO|nr:hypothetical protein PAMC26577_10555 [Caballeronia sordidicola]
MFSQQHVGAAWLPHSDCKCHGRMTHIFEERNAMMESFGAENNPFRRSSLIHPMHGLH